jgi:hypothetical protein
MRKKQGPLSNPRRDVGRGARKKDREKKKKTKTKKKSGQNSSQKDTRARLLSSNTAP